jgi:hypothetical protein
MFYLLILVAAASRFLPHPPNVACVGAIGLFAGCYLSGRRAYLVPLAILLLSDVIGQFFSVAGMGFYQPITMAMVYAGAMAAVPVGRWIGRGNRLLLGVPVGSLVASTLFFVLSNLGVWFAGWYQLSLSGLVTCYVNAIPFYGYTVAGDLVFSALLFGVWEASRRGWMFMPARTSPEKALAVVKA